jgi:hypothetical protein
VSGSLPSKDNRHSLTITDGTNTATVNNVVMLTLGAQGASAFIRSTDRTLWIATTTG